MLKIKKKKIKQTFASLKIRNYRLYFFGQVISTTGTWMQVIGQSWLVLTLTKSGTALGIVAALQFLPVLLLGPWGGVIIDRFPKRRLLYITQSVSGVLALILGVLVLTHTATLWMVDIMAFCLGLINAIDSPTRQTFITEMVGEENLLNAVSLNAVQFNITRVLGPTLAALLIVGVGLAPLFFFNAFSYIAVLISLFMMNTKELHIQPIVKKVSGAVAESIRYIKKSVAIRNTLLMMAIIGVFTFEFSVSLPLLAQFTFHGTATTYALLTGGIGVGSIIGGIVTARYKQTSLKELIKIAFFFGISMLLFSVMPTLPLALVMTVIVGYFSINFMSLAKVILQMETDPSMRGRVMSFFVMCYLGSTPIGGPIIGWVSQVASPRAALAVGGAAALLAAGLGYLSLRNVKLANAGTITASLKILEDEALAEEERSGKF